MCLGSAQSHCVSIVADSAETTGLKWQAPASGSTFVGVSVYNSTNQTISNTTETAINFNTERFDTDAFHDNSTNNTRLTVPSGKAGKYLITGFVSFGPATGQRYILIRKNGLAQNYVGFTATAGEGGTTASVIYDLIVGDYIELFVYQASGGNLTCFTGINYGTFAMNLLGA